MIETREATTAADPPSVWDWEPTADVWWGRGGIDDWGWTAWDHGWSPDQGADSPSTTIAKETIAHV
jgi:hypothetical protein